MKIIRRPGLAVERRLMIPWLGSPGGAPGRRRTSVADRALSLLIRDAALSFHSGDYAAADRGADAVLRMAPRSSLGPAIKALIAAQSGDRAAAERRLASARGWLRALRGMLRARWGEHDAARRDLEATRRIERSAWACAARAAADNRVGRFRSALKELAGMRSVLPSSPEPDLLASAIHLEQAQYAEAAACLSRAARSAPADAEIRRRLSRVYFVEGDLPSARREIEAACRLSPGDAELRQERLRLCLLLDDEAASRSQLREKWPPGVRDFWRAYAACRAGRFAESRRLFAAAEGACGDERLARTSALYRRVAQILSEAPKPQPPSGKELLILGMGFRHPYQVSVEVLRALRGCEEYFCNLSDSAVVDLLGLFGVPLRTIVFRRSNGQSTSCARIVMRAMKSLGRAGVVTRGQPVYYGRLAARLVRDCAARGIDCRVPPSVSIADLFPSLVGRVRGEALGFQVRDRRSLAGLDARLPVLIYNFSSGKERRELCRKIRARHAAGEACWLLAGSGALEYEPVETTVGEVEAAMLGADHAVTILLPAVRS